MTSNGIPPASPGRAGSARSAREDEEDLQSAHVDPGAATERVPFWRHLGPGLITGAADDDPSGIGTYSVAGAQFGYGMLWMAPMCVPLMTAVQEMCGRIAAITGKGLAAVLKEHSPRWVLFGAVALLVVANTINVWADLNAMAASLQMLFGLPLAVWLAATTVITLALVVLVPYRIYVKYLKWLCLSLLAYVVTALLPHVHNNWGQILRHTFIPGWSSDPAFIMTVVGFLGTTISPYCFFWQASETVEEEVAEGSAASQGGRITRVRESEIRSVRADTLVGMLASQVITFFIIICTTATLHDRGITDVRTAQDAAQALLPLGRAAYWLFTLGIVGTGLLAIPTLAGSAAYALSEMFGWRYGLFRRFRRAQAFYLMIGAVVVAGFLLNFVRSISPLKGLVYAAVLNGLAAPPLIILVLRICNDSRIVGKHRNGTVSNVLGWATVVLMTAAALYMLGAALRGRL